MAWGDPSDYWWLKPVAPAQVSPAMQFGAQLKQQAINNALRQKDLELENQRTGIQIQKYFSDKELEMYKMAGTAALAKRMSGFRDMTDPAIPEVIYGELAKSPMLAPIAERFLDDHRQALQFKQRQEELAEIRLSRERIAADRLFGVTGDKQTSAMTNLKAADNAEAQAKMIEATDPEQAASLRRNAAILRSTNVAPSEIIETYTDDKGEKQFRVVRGPTGAGTAPKDLSTPTVATASQIQQRMLAADKTIELGAKLMGSLTDADVGVRGNVNQVVINEGLAQLIPGLQKGQVTEARTMLGQFNENAMKAIASDPRISDRDRQRYEKILPTLGAVESIASAKDKIKVFMDRFRDQSRTDAIAAKLPIPNWALTVSELQEKIAKKELTLDEATKILVRYHP